MRDPVSPSIHQIHPKPQILRTSDQKIHFLNSIDLRYTTTWTSSITINRLTFQILRESIKYWVRNHILKIWSQNTVKCGVQSHMQNTVIVSTYKSIDTSIIKYRDHHPHKIMLSMLVQIWLILQWILFLEKVSQWSIVCKINWNLVVAYLNSLLTMYVYCIASQANCCFQSECSQRGWRIINDQILSWTHSIPLFFYLFLFFSF